ncbi:MAG: Mut7-C RNAse domain-containing protein [Dehalococcoidia bacterium]|nr:MAG: Mut7-C RNAse domain-containing protein [Dehalococcoidia bacterium]
MRQIEDIRFIVDHNVGKLAKWLRMMGYDTLFFKGSDDSGLIATALSEDRIILTKDTGIAERRLVTRGRLTTVLLTSDEPVLQIKQVIDKLNLDVYFKPFSICLECNQELMERSGEQVRERVPPYVFKIQNHYMECSNCQRIYWRGTHWQAMERKLAMFSE